jgi:hypothetical protein
MLGVMPGVKNHVQEMVETEAISPISPKQECSKQEEVNPHKTSFIKRFSSFRKSDKTQTKQTSSGNLVSSSNMIPLKENGREKMPAKFIKVTDVKKATLNPVWMEKFQL